MERGTNLRRVVGVDDFPGPLVRRRWWCVIVLLPVVVGAETFNPVVVEVWGVKEIALLLLFLLPPMLLK
jgi:hypothetical protein